jgi:hypothetical protein
LIEEEKEFKLASFFMAGHDHPNIKAFKKNSLSTYPCPTPIGQV